MLIAWYSHKKIRPRSNPLPTQGALQRSTARKMENSPLFALYYAAPCVNTLLGNSCFHLLHCDTQMLRHVTRCITRPVWTRGKKGQQSGLTSFWSWGQILICRCICWKNPDFFRKKKNPCPQENTGIMQQFCFWVKGQVTSLSVAVSKKSWGGSHPRQPEKSKQPRFVETSG